MWLEKAERAGFTELVVLRRVPMTVKRLMRYPVYQEGLLEGLFALVAPEQRDQLVEAALITARSGDAPLSGEASPSCSLPVPTESERMS